MTRLLDINLLMALLWENHEQCEQARAWFEAIPAFATCPLTQLGFARVSSQPQLGYGVLPEDAFGALRRLLADPKHRFVPNDLSASDRVFSTEQIAKPNDITDHYLVALAKQHGLILATFDMALSRAFSAEAGLVELVR